MKMEERYLNRITAWGECIPVWVKALLIPWTVVGLAFVMIEDLQKNIPAWFAVVLTLPYAIIALLLVPAQLMMWGRWISWPFRKIAGLARRARHG